MLFDASAPVLLIVASGSVLVTSIATDFEFLRKAPAARSGSPAVTFAGLAIEPSRGQGPSSVRKEIAAASGMFHPVQSMKSSARAVASPNSEHVRLMSDLGPDLIG